MSVESTGTAMGAGIAPVRRSGKRTLGVIAVLLAVVCAPLPYLPNLLYAAGVDSGAGTPAGSNLFNIAYLVHLAGMVGALVLGIIATVTRRGRAWGIAAIVISVLFGQMLLGSLVAAALYNFMPVPTG
ncbi:hypothetical protein ACFFGH_33660 [Lysobacter korlensis]|uniref:Uncharacterized protein n=1 Tax=Lysobacter korlensis TaxID=553636 RepID=A0ABV6S0P6_9GAMM